MESVRVVAVAARSAQPPSGAQRCQRRVVAIVAVPLQAPSVAVRTSPSIGAPVIAGTAVFCGGTCGPTIPDAADEAVADALMFVAVTATRSVAPMSASVTTYAGPTAPATGAHDPPPTSQRIHCRA